ncbi:hypothetical protein [Paraburkholderia sp. DGU8]|uniref:hypothetical protein n=1 Tax=Paraburkholderia sp. DGU8 TaxID=3161997 RepID=UPI0034654082
MSTIIFWAKWQDAVAAQVATDAAMPEGACGKRRRKIPFRENKKSIAIGGFLIGVSVLAIDIPGVIRHFCTAYAAMGPWACLESRLWARFDARLALR